MRLTLIPIVACLIAFGAGLSAAADDCPTLENMYFCASANPKAPNQVRTFTQFTNGKFTKFTLKVEGSDGSRSSVEYITDGSSQTRIEKGSDGKSLSVTEWATCDKGVLVISGNMQVPVFGDLSYTSEFSRTKTSDLEMHIVAKVSGGGSNDTVKCTLLNPP